MARHGHIPKTSSLTVFSLVETSHASHDFHDSTASSGMVAHGSSGMVAHGSSGVVSHGSMWRARCIRLRSTYIQLFFVRTCFLHCFALPILPIKHTALLRQLTLNDAPFNVTMTPSQSWNEPNAVYFYCKYICVCILCQIIIRISKSSVYFQRISTALSPVNPSNKLIYESHYGQGSGSSQVIRVQRWTPRHDRP